MNLRILFTFSVLVLTVLPACKSDKEKCIETTDETYAREMAACTDDACKQAAEKNKLDFYEACNSK